MVLTKKQRNNIYKRMLEYAINDPRVNYGFCALIDYIFLTNTGNYEHIWWSISIEKDSLVELYNKKPESFWGYWFPLDTKGWKKRIKLLEECIEETN